MSGAAPSLPNESARAALGLAVASLGFWLLSSTHSAWAVVPGLLVLVAAGYVAGRRTAWFAVPAGVWIFVAAFLSADCGPECGEGRVGPPLDRAVLLTLAMLLLAELGASLELFFPWKPQIRSWPIALVPVFLASAAVAVEVVAVA